MKVKYNLGLEGTFYYGDDFKFNRKKTKTSTKITINGKVRGCMIEYYNNFPEERRFEGCLWIRISQSEVNKLDLSQYLAPDKVEVNSVLLDFDADLWLFT